MTRYTHTPIEDPHPDGPGVLLTPHRRATRTVVANTAAARGKKGRGPLRSTSRSTQHPSTSANLGVLSERRRVPVVWKPFG